MTDCEHEWMVFSTALVQRCLMQECPKCDAYGTVDKPTRGEWSDAFYAPSNPYRWHDNSRVTLQSSTTSMTSEVEA